MRIFVYSLVKKYFHHKGTKNTKKIEEIVLKPFLSFVSFVVIHIKP